MVPLTNSLKNSSSDGSAAKRGSSSVKRPIGKPTVMAMSTAGLHGSNSDLGHSSSNEGSSSSSGGDNGGGAMEVDDNGKDIHSDDDGDVNAPTSPSSGRHNSTTTNNNDNDNHTSPIVQRSSIHEEKETIGSATKDASIPINPHHTVYTGPASSSYNI